MKSLRTLGAKGRICVLTLVSALLLAAFTVPAASADHVLLNANFNGETVGQPPATGGAVAGEPIYNVGSGIIGLAPLPTPNLQLRQPSGSGSGSEIIFAFLNDEEVVDGTVQIRADVQVSGAAQWEIGLREYGSYSQNFMDFYNGENTTGTAAYVGTVFHPSLGYFTANQIAHVAIDVNAAQNLLSLQVNGVTWLDKVQNNLNTTRGVGMILFETMGTSASDDVMRVDNLRAVSCTSTVFTDCLFVDGFDH